MPLLLGVTSVGFTCNWNDSFGPVTLLCVGGSVVPVALNVTLVKLVIEVEDEHLSVAVGAGLPVNGCAWQPIFAVLTTGGGPIGPCAGGGGAGVGVGSEVFAGNATACAAVALVHNVTLQPETAMPTVVLML